MLIVHESAGEVLFDPAFHVLRQHITQTCPEGWDATLVKGKLGYQVTLRENTLRNYQRIRHGNASETPVDAWNSVCFWATDDELPLQVFE